MVGCSTENVKEVPLGASGMKAKCKVVPDGNCPVIWQSDINAFSGVSVKGLAISL